MMALASATNGAMGTAWRHAQETADALASELALSKGTVDDRLAILDKIAYRIGGLIGHDLVDITDAADLIDLAATSAGLHVDAGPDAVQEAMAAGFREGGNAAREERAVAETGNSETLTISRCLADVEAQPISWFWPSRIALGKLSLVAGVPGLGKSQLTCALIAAATTGGRLPDGEEAPLGSAIMITAEDDAGDTIRPRLEAAGADLRRVHLLDWVLGSSRDGKPERQHFNVSAHGAALADLVRKIGDVRLIVIDPVTAHLGKTDSHVTAEVRGALAPLQRLAAESGAAIILISHLNKGGADSSAMNRVTGSGAFIAVCRSAWLVAPDPKDAENRRRMFVPLKNNLGDDKTGFAFQIEGHQLPNGISTSRVAFEPFRVFVTADDLLQQAKPGAEAARSALDEACEFLRDELKNGPRPRTEIATAAKEELISPRTLRRARELVCEKPKKGEDRRSVWRLKSGQLGQGGQ